MLSDHEQRALLELLRQFLAEDPDFARSFDEVGQRDSAFSLQWVDAMPRWVPTAAVVGTVALGVLMLAIGIAAAALVLAMLAATIVVLRRRRKAPGRAGTCAGPSRWPWSAGTHGGTWAASRRPLRSGPAAAPGVQGNRRASGSTRHNPGRFP